MIFERSKSTFGLTTDTPADIDLGAMLNIKYEVSGESEFAVLGWGLFTLSALQQAAIAEELFRKTDKNR